MNHYQNSMIFTTWIQRKIGCSIVSIHSDDGGEYENNIFETFIVK